MTEAAHTHHDHAHGGHDAPHPHGSMRSYMLGFVLSVILTAIPFALVMTGVLGSAKLTGIVIMLFAAVQIVVHVFCFLHVDAKSEEGWTMMALIFTLVMVIIILTGSQWVMYNLNRNMAPMSVHDMSQMP